MLRSMYRRLDKPRRPTAPQQHDGQLALGLSDNAASGRGNGPTSREGNSARARRTDPSTSHAAAANVDRFAGGHYRLILEALATPGTIHEISARTFRAGQGISEVQCARRLPELHAAKRAEPTEEKRDGARVWRRC